ncbi:methyltransferase domain-containing protein [Enhygromyxa salina]|uniref:methyltransferase domain-containing protein n=1 Tax=Enhygromyxa salina TaxID=215803 RepID=UPI0011B210ED|nr:methyltransferase domain-containing protein [Enhygromyxa salina]
MPAYLALERWVHARTVVVVQPSGPEGPRRLLAAGARRVLVIGGDFPPEPDMEVRPASGARLPLRDGSIDVVLCIEAFGGLRSTDRRELLRESHRILRTEGLFCAWIEQREVEAFGRTLLGSSQVDFWALEDQINAIFPRVDMLAQMPWQGFSLAPILDEDTAFEGEEPQLALREELLEEAPEASHFLAIASKSRIPAELGRECLLIPLPRDEVFGFNPQAERDGAEIEELRDELDRLREELSLRAAKVAATHGRVRELESQLESLRARSTEVEAAEVERLRDALTEAETQLSIFRAREQEQGVQIARLEDERSELLANLELARTEQTSVGVSVASTEAELRRELEEAQARAREAEDSLRGADERLRSHETDLQILTRTSGEQDKAVERLTAQLDTERQALEAARAEERQLRERLESLDSEREELRRQNDVYVAEREGARKLAQRMEAELEVVNRRAKDQDLALSAKVEESSRLAGELEAMRRRLAEAESALTQTRTRAEELSATAAQGAEQGRMLADVAVDRDRLRDELSQRNRQLEELEARMWETREALQKERLEGVRASGEVERLREQVERARAEEQKRGREVEELGRELRALEVAKAEASALLRARDEQIARLQGEAEALAGQSADVDELRAQLRERNEKLASLAEQVAAVEARDERIGVESKQTQDALDQANARLAELEAQLDEHSGAAAAAAAELEVKRVEVEQLSGTVAGLQAQLEEAREHTKQRETEKAVLQRQLEEAAAIRDSLRRQLRERERDVDRLSNDQDTHSLELLQLRRELEVATEAADQLERGESEGPSAEEIETWPEAARRELERLRAAMAVQARDHGRRLTEARAETVAAAPGADGDRLHRLRLEVQVRTAEQEYMLASLDSAEQKIWEMTDASDRNAARFAASLAQLEKHKETVDSLLDELEVTRNLLAAEQARALEQERMLASERAKMARAGIGVDGFPATDASEDDPFANFDGEDLLDLGEDPAPGRAPQPKPSKASVASAKKPARPPGRGVGEARPTAQELDQALASLTDDDADDEASFGGAAQTPEPDAPAARSRARSSSSARVAAGSGPSRAAGVAGEVTVSRTRKIERPSTRARMTVEAVDDDEWPED